MMGTHDNGGTWQVWGLGGAPGLLVISRTSDQFSSVQSLSLVQLFVTP